MPAGGSCLLGSINLSEFVDENGNFNFDDLAETVYTATVALNDVLEEGLPLHPLEEQRKSVGDWRQIGLGVMGVADMLIKMGIRYGSEDSITLCEQISNYILNFAMFASANLASERGAYSYYNYDCVSSTQFYKENVWDKTDEAVKAAGLRNSQLLTIAPTGTLSTMLGISGGVEAIFANSYERKTQSLHGKDVFYKVYTPIVKKYMDEHAIADENELPDFFITAQQIPYIERIKMQAAWQKSIDASISSTINLPNSATVEDVEHLYYEAWKNGLKGVTIFRDGCKRAGVLVTEQKKEEKESEEYSNKSFVSTTLPRGYIMPANDNVIGKKRKLGTGCGSLHCTAFFDPYYGNLCEVYLSKGSTGGCQQFMVGLSRMISLAARAGCDIHDIIDQLNSCGTCPSYAIRRATKHDTSAGSCCPMAVGNALLDMWKEMQEQIADRDDDFEFVEASSEPKQIKLDKKPIITETSVAKCPECGAPITHEGGCVQCKNCGWSKCN